ncbi:hypothetical protein ACS5NO_12650 [Larkinella sp. GY13]|uniref:hypothetical protein n=1 Tax=Larkinella sp. GY13 TaxID=3453720 RepID=UPI003EED7EFA
MNLLNKKKKKGSNLKKTTALKRAIKQFRRKLKHKEYRRERNRMWLGIQEGYKAWKSKMEYKYGSYKHITAPANLSFKHNPEQLLFFIQRLRKAFEKRDKVYVHLFKVQTLDYDAIVALLSIMVRFKALRIGFQGDLPINRTAKQILIDSGFFDGLNRTFNDQARYRIGDKNQIICTHAFKTVDSSQTAKLIEQAAVFLWHEKRRCTGVQRALVELMQNTTDHADPNKPADKHWWLSMYLDQAEHKACFAFIDFGVGIFKSLETKPLSDKFANWQSTMQRFFKFADNSDLLRLMLNGAFHSTVTGKHYRGKGLPGLKETMDRNQLSNLHVISNDVYADVENNAYRILENHFDGTFVCWEVTINSENLPV